ncbi:MAG: DUF1848 domain-containing protein [Selenomonadaceae bacterium]|nr:DUF1848 domain-containing protein [Selenomonadaceae bacterium]
MIINTGMRTDIPAFYAEWFMNRVREGYVLVRSPYNPQLVTRYRLNPDVVDVLGFCTKNPAPMLPYLQELKEFRQFWYVTITPYGKEIEPNVPAVAEVITSFKKLSLKIGPAAVGWRYDPILLNGEYTLQRHIEEFEKMAKAMSGYTEVCVISFIDLYNKVRRNFPQAREVERNTRLELGKKLAEIGAEYGIRIKACGEGRELEKYGIDCDGCLTAEVYERAAGAGLVMPKINKSRKECSCYLGADIGAYDSCGHLCRYCYANTDRDAVAVNRKRHEPKSPFLIGREMPGDIIKEAKQESWKNREMNLFSIL